MKPLVLFIFIALLAVIGYGAYLDLQEAKQIERLP